MAFGCVGGLQGWLDRGFLVTSEVRVVGAQQPPNKSRDAALLSFVGQVVNLRRIGNPPADDQNTPARFVWTSTGGFTIRRRLTTCPTSNGVVKVAGLAAGWSALQSQIRAMPNGLAFSARLAPVDGRPSP